MKELIFLYQRKIIARLKCRINFCINVFCYENKVVYPVYLSDQKFSDSMDLLLISDKFKSHYVYIKDFDRFMFNKIKYKGKNFFCKNCLRCFSSEKVLSEHKEDCLVKNGKQSVKLESGFISFKNYSKQIPVSFKIYADFECILEKVDGDIECSSYSSYTRKYQNHVPCIFAYKVLCVDNKFSKKIVLYRGKDVVCELIKSIFKEYNYCRSVVEKHFNKNLIMSEEENEIFELTNICWICSKLIENSDDKVREHCHVSGNWSCNINLKITKKVPVIFHNFKGCDSHLIDKELSKFNVKISVIPNGLEKYMAFTINKNSVFIDSMQFMNSSLDKLVKNLNDKYFKYLSEEFSDEQLKLGKEKGIYPYEYMSSFKRFTEDKLPNKSKFVSSLKDSGVKEK